MNMLHPPAAKAHEPTKISTAPYPWRPNIPPIDEPLPASSKRPDSIGPTTADMPLKMAVDAIAMPVYSGLPPAQSNAAFGQVEEKPPLCGRVCERMLRDDTVTLVDGN